MNEINIEVEDLEKVFTENDSTFAIFFSPHKKTLAYIVLMLKRIVGSKNIDYNNPWYSEPKKRWSMKVQFRIPERLLKNAKYQETEAER